MKKNNILKIIKNKRFKYVISYIIIMYLFTRGIVELMEFFIKDVGLLLIIDSIILGTAWFESFIWFAAWIDKKFEFDKYKEVEDDEDATPKQS